MKKILILLLALALLPSAAFANDNISVIINGEELETPIAPRIVDERLMLPMRSVFESLGAKVNWFDKDKIIFAAKSDSLITLKIGVAQMSLQKISSDENISVPLDAAPYIENEYTLIPVRAAAEALNAKVDWMDDTKTVIITTEQRNGEN